MLPGGKLVQHQTERKNVGGGVHLFDPRLFRRHVKQRPDAGARVGCLVPLHKASCITNGKLAGQAEIKHFDDAVTADHDVGGFQVAMDNAGGVSGRQRPGSLAKEPSKLFDGSALAEEFLQRAARLPTPC